MPPDTSNQEKGKILSGLVSGRLKEIEERLHSSELVEIYGKGPLGYALNEILLIKDWSKISGLNHDSYSYMGNPALDVKRNFVIIAVSSANIVGKGGADPPYILLTGPGLYQVELSMQRGMYIEDSREITGILLSTPDWEKMRSARKDYDGTSALILNQLIAEIPLSIIDRPSSLQSYERGLIANTVTTPFKDAFVSLKNLCSRGTSYPEEHGPKLLSTHRLLHNMILVGKEIYEWAAKTETQRWNEIIVKEAREYLQAIPGTQISKSGELDTLLQSEVVEGVSRGYLKDSRRGISLTDVPSIKEFIMRVELRMAKEQYLKAIAGLFERGR
ncbi:MAG: hypothetical protein WED04_00655 [Promethearchaeati archaeon SRVP18_Atabeyarchaeia-1]